MTGHVGSLHFAGIRSACLMSLDYVVTHSTTASRQIVRSKTPKPLFSIHCSLKSDYAGTHLLIRWARSWHENKRLSRSSIPRNTDCSTQKPLPNPTALFPMQQCRWTSPVLHNAEPWVFCDVFWKKRQLVLPLSSRAVTPRSLVDETKDRGTLGG